MPVAASPLRRACDSVLREAAAGFPEARHRMRFPSEMGFSARDELQSTDVFARAVLGDLLVDMATLADTAALAATFRDLAHRQAAHVTAARLPERACGWSYFPDLPELPADADSLAAALLLFVRAAPEFVPLCAEAVERVLQTQTDDGSIETWILSNATSGSDAHDRSVAGIRRHWGRDRAVDVCARFFRALHLHDAVRYGDAIARGSAFVRQCQDSDGGWRAEWYFGRCYPTMLAVELQAALDPGVPAIGRALAHLTATQRSDGGWGVWESVPLDTAVALWLLARHGNALHRDAITGGLALLLGYQADAGHWRASPWIKMDVGRPQDFLSHTLTYQSRTITTAFCLRSLMLLQRTGFEMAMSSEQ